MNNNYTTYSNTEKIKQNMVLVFAEWLRYSGQNKYPEHADKIDALEKFIRKIAKIKDLMVLQRIRKFYNLRLDNE